MEIIFVTSNKGKVNWMQSMLSGLGIKVVQKELELNEPRYSDVLEVVKHKCEEAKIKINLPFIVEDSGFYIEALGGFPATFVKFGLATLGVDRICKLLENEKNKKAYFMSVLVYFDGKETHFFSCKDEGIVANIPRGSNIRGFNDLFKIFIPNGFNKTLAEMSDKEYKEYQNKIAKNDHYQLFGRWFSNEAKSDN